MRDSGKGNTQYVIVLVQTQASFMAELYVDLIVCELYITSRMVVEPHEIHQNYSPLSDLGCVQK